MKELKEERVINKVIIEKVILMLYWYCKTIYNLKQVFSPKTTYNLGPKEY